MARSPKTITIEAPIVALEKKNRTSVALVFLFVLLIMALSIAGYFYYQYKNTTQVQQAEELEKLSAAIGNVMELPQNETPTLATVTDKEKLAGQAFFQKAENGDKVLIYSQSGRAILYRPSTKKVVDVTSVNINAPVQPVKEPEAPLAVMPAEASAPVRVSLLNGSDKSGITNSVEDQLKQTYPTIEVIAKEKAAKSDYTGTTVIDLSGKNADLAGKIAISLGGSVGSIPAEETAPADTDILIIVSQ